MKDITMKKILLVNLLLLSVNVFADECHDAYFNHEFDKASSSCEIKAKTSSIKDNWEAPLILGNMYDRGYIGAKNGYLNKTNYQRALYWYEMAAKRGNCTAMLDIQLMIENYCMYANGDCDRGKSRTYGNMLRMPMCNNLPVNYLSNNSRYYSLVSQNRSQDFLPTYEKDSSPK